MLILFNFHKGGQGGGGGRETAEKIEDNHMTLSRTQFSNEKSINDAVVIINCPIKAEHWQVMSRFPLACHTPRYLPAVMTAAIQ